MKIKKCCLSPKKIYELTKERPIEVSLIYKIKKYKGEMLVKHF
jgi:hypothetical protein